MSFHWLVGEIIKEDAALATAPSQDLPRTPVVEPELDELLAEHRKWLESKGACGKRLELARANFEGVDLTGANLQDAILNKANFHGAELLLADLRGASLVQANLQETNLLGADFQGANLEGASLEGAAGLHTKQLAGASLLWTILPAQISEFEGQQIAEFRARKCYRLLIITLAASALSWMRLVTTHDAQLLRDAPLLPISRLGGALPISGFYTVMPLALFGLFLYFHVSLHRLWERLVELPAVFPDGRTLDCTGPWLLMTLFRSRFRDWNVNRISPSFLETMIPALLAYWVVPATLLLFWGRYLVMQDLRAAMLQIFLLMCAIGVATAFPHGAGNETRNSSKAASPAPDPKPAPDPNPAADVMAIPVPDSPERPKASAQYIAALRRAGIAIAAGAILLLLTLGIVYGVPHDASVMPDYSQASVRRWSAAAFSIVGYRPYPELTESSISTAPANWSGRNEDLGSVKGAQLNDRRLRYAEGYRTFWANAHLWKADLQGAYFSESDFRGANLREANLRSTSFDRTQFFRANLQGASLQKANLIRADLREADLSYAVLSDAVLVDAHLEGANLFSADLHSAQLAHASFERADLRDSNLINANLTLSDLQEAYLWSAKLSGAQLRDARLGHAILIEADLRGSDLRGASLQGAVLRGTDFTGADIAGADFRGASGLTAWQVCSAKNHQTAVIDDTLTASIQAQCGTSAN